MASPWAIVPDSTDEGDESFGLEDDEDLGDEDLGDDDLGDEDSDDEDSDDEDTGDGVPGDEDGQARADTADSTSDEPSPFEIHYLPPGDPPGDPGADDEDPETAGDPGPDSPGAGDAADGDDGGPLNG